MIARLLFLAAAAVSVGVHPVADGSIAIPRTIPNRKAFVRIDATGCPGGARRGSGFVWNNGNTVVTALHVVAGCGSIQVWYPVNHGVAKDAQVSRVRIANDLAMLSVTGAPSVVPLQASTTSPAAGTSMTAWGYPVVTRGLLDTHLARRQTGTNLQGLLNAPLLKEVLAEGMPSVTAPIVLLDEGHLLPGHSGAPLVDGAGVVLAIADGGLEQGASEITWAIPATELSGLVTSNDPIPAAGGGGSVLFAADIVDPSLLGNFSYDVDDSSAIVASPRTTIALTDHGLVCGSATFAKVRTREFTDIASTADDQAGLQQLLSMSGNFLQPNDKFDIYEEISSGATVVVPVNATLRQDGNLCTASLFGGTLVEYIGVADASTPFQVQQASLGFEHELANRLGGNWQIDPTLTYVFPMNRYDGLVVRRKGNQQLIASPVGPVFDKYLFETLAARRGKFLGVGFVRKDYNPQMLQLRNMCFAGAPLPQCPTLQAEYRQIAQMLIAIHLSTFPIGCA